MRWLPDRVVDNLRRVADTPDLSDTTFRIVEEIGRGGMGTVYLAEDAALGRRVALKVLHLADPTGEMARRMLREARIIARLEHPGIVPVHDVGTLPDGRVYYAMKLVKGERLTEYRRRGASLPDLLRAFERVCDAVAFAHSQDVVHRDLTPDNIMVGAFGEVLVLDWGVAKEIRIAGRAGQETPLRMGVGRGLAPEGTEAAGGGQGSVAAADAPLEPTSHGTVIGTPAYMAPEQASGEVDRIDNRTDVYALGAILHFLLTGHPPDAPGAASEARLRGPDVSRALAAVCLRAMAVRPADRYATASQLGSDVARYLDALPVAAYREGFFERAARVAKRYRTPLLLVAAYLVMRLILLAWTRN